MIVSVIVGLFVFGSGFVVLITNPMHWWLSLGIGVIGSLVFARWYSGVSRKSFVILGTSSILFVVSSYLYALLVDPHYLAWYALVCLAVVVRWQSLWYAYSFDKDRYPLLSIPNMSVWFLGLALTLACANVWGYQLYFGYSHLTSVILCTSVGAISGCLALSVLKQEFKTRALIHIGALVLFLELQFVLSLFTFVPVVRGLISSTLFLLLITMIRGLGRPSERFASELIRGSVFACCSVAIVLLLVLL